MITSLLSILLLAPQRLIVVEAQGPYASQHVEQQTAEVMEYWGKNGAAFRLVKKVTIPDPLPHYASLTSTGRWIEMLAWGRYLRRNGLRNRRTITHVVLPPIERDGYLYAQGIANGICQRGRKSGFSLSNSLVSKPPSLIYWRTNTAFAHELGHLLGGSHQFVGCSVMHPNAMFCAEDSIPEVLHNTRKQMRRCKRRSVVK